MSSRAKALNQLFLEEMRTGKSVVLERIRDLWWDTFESHCTTHGAYKALDQLDLFMDSGQDRLLDMANLYALSKEHVQGSDRFRQATTQFIKSNTGKMFERFAGLSLCHALAIADSSYCVLPFRKDTLRYCGNLRKEDFSVCMAFGGTQLTTAIDSDLFAFNAENPSDEVFLLSIKSTLKDRFHSVPFWNLLRRASLSADMPETTAINPNLLGRVNYIAICTDLAEEQPDFRDASGPRNLLQIDAALLDGAYVSSSRALGLPEDCNNHVGNTRDHAFYRYSCFYEYLVNR